MGAAVALVALAGDAAPAAAHAELRSSDPVDGQVLDAAPAQVVLRFSEPVEVAFGALRVYDGQGRRLQSGPSRHPRGDTRAVIAGLPPLRTGTYVVTWRLASADAHNVRGALTFRVGPAPPGQAEGLARRLLAAQGEDPAVGAVSAVVRVVGFASLIAFVGAGALIVLAWPAGAADARARRLLWTSWAGLVGATVAGVGLQGASAAGLGVADALRPSIVAEVLDTRFGRLSVARLILLAAAVMLLVRAVGHGRIAGRRLPRGASAGVALGLLGTVALSGHAATGDAVPLAVTADVAHLAAICLWLGGLTLLSVAVLRREQIDAAEKVAARFSSLAVVAVPVIVVTGAFAGWRQVGSVAALTGTTYGRLLALKVGLVAVVIGLGAMSRSRLRRRLPVSVSPVAVSPGPGAAPARPARLESTTDGLQRLRRSVAAEVAVAAAVLVVASLLVSAVPGRTAFGHPFSTELDARRVLIDLTVDPAKSGAADFHVYSLDRNGQVAEVAGMEAELRLPSKDVGPLRVPLRRAGGGHFAAYGFTLPLPGTWELTLTVELPAGGSEQVTATLPVR